MRITISFDVNTVKTLVNAYKAKKRAYWFVFALFVANWARYLNNPNSSKRIEIIVIEKNKINIFIGLTLVSLSSLSFNVRKEIDANISIKIAPIKLTTIYELISKFLILIFGRNRIDKIKAIQVIPAITIDTIIKSPSNIILLIIWFVNMKVMKMFLVIVFYGFFVV